MDTKAIREILNLINKSDLTEVEIEQKDFKIRVKKGSAEESIVYSSIQMQPQMPQQHLQAYPQPVPQQLTESNPASPPKEDAVANVVAAADEKLHTFKSPMIGTFYRASGPDKDVFVNVGDSISPGKVVCIIEAMKLFNEIESEISGKIVKILIDDASPVEYDQPLFLIELT